MFDPSVISLRTAKAFAKHFTCLQTKPQNTDDIALAWYISYERALPKSMVSCI